jgi:FHA domain
MTVSQSVPSAIKCRPKKHLLSRAACLCQLLVILLPLLFVRAAHGEAIDPTGQWPRADCPPRCLPAPPPRVEPPPPVAAAPPSAAAPESRWSLRFVVPLVVNAPVLWLIVLALAAAGIVAAILASIRPQKTALGLPMPAVQDPGFSMASSGLTISPAVSIVPGTRPDKRRLRLYPLGRNDLAPIDVLFETELTVGRSPESDICISNDGQVSAKHCTLSPKDGAILVQDTDSRNGTRVNGVRIEGFLHAETDSILGVGRTELRMRLLPAGGRRGKR